MKGLRSTLWSLLLISLIPAALAQQGTEPITATDLLKIQELGQVTASPDGRFVAYTATAIVPKPDAEDEYTYRSQLFLIPVYASNEPQQLTFDDRGASQPAWHPDGDRLAFVRTVDGKAQLFEISVFGGEARQLTTFEHGAGHPIWSPNGRRLLFSTSLSEKTLAEMMQEAPVWSDERPGRTRGDTNGAEADPAGSLADIRAWLDENSTEDSFRRPAVVSGSAGPMASKKSSSCLRAASSFQPRSRRTMASSSSIAASRWSAA